MTALHEVTDYDPVGSDIELLWSVNTLGECCNPSCTRLTVYSDTLVRSSHWNVAIAILNAMLARPF